MGLASLVTILLGELRFEGVYIRGQAGESGFYLIQGRQWLTFGGPGVCTLFSEGDR